MIVGMYIRHIKAYKGIKYIPIGHRYNFVSYLGENGIGKSSILETLDCFFNNKNYPINKSALKDGIKTKSNEPFVTPIFLIEKSKIHKKYYPISNFFWKIDIKDLQPRIQKLLRPFFELREQLLEFRDSHYLIVIGDSDKKNCHFGPFQSILQNENEENNINLEEKIKQLNQIKSLGKDLLGVLKSMYSYVYIPVELDIENFTKIETIEMQKIFNKEIKLEVTNALKDVNISKANGINEKLDNFVSEIESILDKEYTYKSITPKKTKLTILDLVDTILTVYFQKRVLYKKEISGDKKITELSSGEKRQALINLVYAFLKSKGTRDKYTIVAIDEPENSLHSSLCYEQFEKIKEIALLDQNQFLITTHWYGYLPIMSRGYSHFLEKKGEEIEVLTFDLYNYRSKIEINSNFMLKSMNDLVQSIFYSLIQKKPYNWIICEGISEKIYFEYFFEEEIKSKNLRILPMNGKKNVIRLFNYLYTPIQNEVKKAEFGKIMCIIDTDNETVVVDKDSCKNLVLKRFLNIDENATQLVNANSGNIHQTDIEQSLNPIIFTKTLLKLEKNEEVKFSEEHIKNKKGNTSFILNFKNLELMDFFKENSGINKIIFAQEYIKILKEEENKELYIPNWVKEIKTFLFN